jgi:hypothetical protein
MVGSAFRDLSIYPFLVDLEDFLEKEGLPRNIEDLLASRYLEEGFKRVLEDIEDRIDHEERRDYIERILSFYIGILLISMTNDRRIYRKFSEAEAERVYRHLLKSPPTDVLSILSLMGYKVERTQEGELCVAIDIDRSSYELRYRCYSYKISLPDYLRILTITGVQDIGLLTDL